MESNDLAFFLIYETVLLLVLGFSIKRRLTTLDISQHGPGHPRVSYSTPGSEFYAFKTFVPTLCFFLLEKTQRLR